MSLTAKVPSFPRRIAAFTLVYLLIAGYLVLLATISSYLSFGPLEDGWRALISSPWHMDLVAFSTCQSY